MILGMKWLLFSFLVLVVYLTISLVITKLSQWTAAINGHDLPSKFVEHWKSSLCWGPFLIVIAFEKTRKVLKKIFKKNKKLRPVDPSGGVWE